MKGIPLSEFPLYFPPNPSASIRTIRLLIGTKDSRESAIAGPQDSGGA